MKYVKMEYPNGSIHNTLIKEYNHSEDKDVDFIEYFDMTDNKELYAVLKTIDGTIYKDSNSLDYTYDELSSKKVQKNMDELPDLIENMKTNSKEKEKYELEFEVYNTNSGYYIPSSIAVAFHLDKKYRTKKIKDVICVPVSEDEIKRIELISSQGIPSLKSKIINELDLKAEYQTQAEFIVYHLVDANKYFIDSKLCEEFNVGNGTHFINGILCKEVTYNDIKEIEERTKESNPCLKSTFVELSFEKNTIEVYRNTNTNKYYIKDETCTKNGIGTGHHYIDNVLYREVNKDELLNLQSKKIDFKFKNLQLQAVIQQYIVYVDEYSNRYFVEESTSKKLGIGRGTHYIGDKLCKEVTLKEIKEVAEASKYGGIKYEPQFIFLTFDKNREKSKSIKPTKEILTDVYKDKTNNNKLFVSKEDCAKYNIGDHSSFKYINNKECYEISLLELTKIKKPVVKTVHLQKEVNFEVVKNDKKSFTVCVYDKYNFISEEIAQLYNINYKTFINVDGKKYVHVKENDIQEVERLSGLLKNVVNIKPISSNKNELTDMLIDKVDDPTIYNNKKIK